MSIKFSFGKCQTKAAYSAKLQQKGSIDLQKIREKFTVILDTPILVVVKVEDMEIIVHGYGELLFKKGKDIVKMEQIAEDIYKAGIKG